MPNTRNPQTPVSSTRRGQSQDAGRQWQGNQSQEDDDLIEDGDESVEVGDPVPEDQRTIRASRDNQGLSNGQGETGEDEGLSGDAGDDERH